MMKKKILVATLHGSHLYGTATPNSDIDYYSVYDFLNKNWRPRKQVKQNISINQDITFVSLDRFTEMCYKGVPQTLEVLFSHPGNWIEHTAEWLDISEELSSRITTKSNLLTILDTYRRTAINFAREDDFKKNRHALRLCINAKQLKDCRWMSPTLDQKEIEKINRYAMLPYEHRMVIFKREYFGIFDDV